VAGLLGSHISNSPHHVKNSTDFVHTLGPVRARPQINFDVVSLFIGVPSRETMSLLGRHFEEDILTLCCHVLASSYFSFAGQLYEQIDGMAIWVHPYLQSLPTSSWRTSRRRRSTGLPRNPSAGFITWMTLSLSGPDKLRDFLDHLNSVHQNIQFTMEAKRDGHLPFLNT
jgi:hypothetical protein